MKDLLFQKGDLSNIGRVITDQVRQKVDEIPKSQFINTPDDDLVSHCVSMLSIDPLVIYEDRMEQEHTETKVDVSGDFRRSPRTRSGPSYISGIKIKISLPFTGDKSLWHIIPHSLYISPRPFGHIIQEGEEYAGVVEMEFDFPTDEQPEKIKDQIDRNLKYMRDCIFHQKKEIDDYNSKLPNVVRQAVNARLKRIQQHDNIVKTLEIPLKRKPGTPEIDPIPIRKKVITKLPPSPKEGVIPEPGIIDDVYEDILKIIRHEGRTWESTPKTYAGHPEEELRDILLSHLNGYYEGAATGETFRKMGKTDIRIEDSSRAAFITECKVWEGAKKLYDGIDQLLSYLTWRDCKTAFLIFNKHNANFSDLISKIPEVFKDHPKEMKEVTVNELGEWRYVFRSQDDDSRLLYIHVFAFNLYIESKKTQPKG